MRAIVCRTYGGPDSLVLEEVPALQPGPDEVVIAVHASGVNFGDILMVQGTYQEKPTEAFSPGYEVAGTVVRIGANVKYLTPGMRVIAFPGIGGYAEEVTVDQDLVYPIPSKVDFISAASILATYGTAYHALHTCAALKSGDTLLVLGAAGGAGLAAVELGRILGARVIAAASSREKLDLCSKYGARDLVNYSDGDFRAALKGIAPAGVNVVFDPVGGELAQAALKATAPHARYLVIGFASGAVPNIPANLLLVKQASAIGVYWGAFLKEYASVARLTVSSLIDLLATKRITPHISKTYPLENAGQAMLDLSHRRVAGKVILLPRPEDTPAIP